MNEDYIQLKLISIPLDDMEYLEKDIKRALRTVLYEPIMRDLLLSPSMIMNARSAVVDALKKGTMRFDKGNFRGKFSAEVTKELRSLGAVWDPKSQSFQIARSDLPGYIQTAIVSGEENFYKLLDNVNSTLTKILPAKISRLIDSVNAFENILAKSEKEFHSTISSITIAPKLSKDAQARIAQDWKENLDLHIKGFLDSEILELRKAVQKSTFAGNRFEALVGMIKKSYGVSERKAHFLARQETNLLLTKYQETRYTAVGIDEYKWSCVVGSPAHPVRPSHKILDGKIFRWDDPPITTAQGQPVRRNNPGEDYNCRCRAVPVIRKK